MLPGVSASSPPSASAARQALVVLVLLQVPVSASYLFAKVAVAELGVLPTVLFRVVLAALLVLGLLRLGGPLALPRPGDRLVFLWLGLLAVPANQGLFLLGMYYAPASHGALLYASSPIMVLALSASCLGERVTPGKVVGVLLGFSGVAVVLLGQGLRLSTTTLIGDVILLGAVLCWAGYTILSKPVLERYSPLYVTGASFVIGALLLVPVIGPLVALRPLPSPGPWGVAAFVWLVLFTSLLGYLAFLWALERLDASRAAILGNLQPLLTAGIAFLAWGEPIAGVFLLGTLLVVAGVVLVQRG
jgi:drug/metabolite transporter (DMT)-like permease